MLPEFPNTLLIGSNSRKTGKTSLACQILETYEGTHSISAIKLAIYDKKEDFDSQYPTASDEGVYILQEQEIGNKDSGRYFAAGAEKSWFIAVMQSEIKQVIDLLHEMKNAGKLIIVESTSLRNYIQPGLFIFVYGSSQKDKGKAVRSLSDMEVETGSDDFKHIDNSICIKQDKWVFC